MTTTAVHVHECRACFRDVPCTSPDVNGACSAFEGLCPQCVRREAEQAILATVENRCFCEHEAHLPNDWCHNDSASGAVADYVGNVCRECADTHYAPYVIWPEPLLDDRHIFTVTRDALAALRRVSPGVEFPTRVVRGSNEVYVPATFAQVEAARAALTD